MVRSPELSDAPALLNYINQLSAEDTFITLSGEQLTLEEEEQYLSSALKQIEGNNKIMLVAFSNDRVVAICEVTRRTEGKQRTHHIGRFGLSVRPQYRRQGVGLALANQILKLANDILELSVVILDVYQPNLPAQALYKKLGFAEYGRLPNGVWYKDNYHERISMMLQLS